MLGFLSFLRVGFPLLVFLAAAGFGAQFVKDYRNMTTSVSELRRELSLNESRLLAYRGMIDRRDAAIGYSQCEVQIKDWLRHPEKLPSPIPAPFSIPGQ